MALERGLRRGEEKLTREQRLLDIFGSMPTSVGEVWSEPVLVQDIWSGLASVEDARLWNWDSRLNGTGSRVLSPRSIDLWDQRQHMETETKRVLCHKARDEVTRYGKKSRGGE